MSATTVITQHAADTASGRLTGSQRMKIKVLRDVATSGALSKAARKDAERGLAQWEATAKGHGYASLAAWEAVR